ncbi:tetratricopeptide repeat protein [Nonomuraea phyllanthi]|uniref:tetratricopeptide repeat protein n=1 Tax=Nonomuraea phyllanthi TaxID=2219224 RepID=UPI0018854B6E|nr:tetratricopeptide repeat protein [Nonomuraea phyllanthi]
MAEPLSWTATYAERLRELHEAAGSPTGQAMAARARKRTPAVKFSTSSWSEWRRGLRVPSDEQTARWLIEEYLRPLADKERPGFVAPPRAWWQQARLNALAELDKGGRPPTRHPPAPPFERPPLVQVGQIPQEAHCFQEREIASRLQDAAAQDGAVVLCQVLAGMGGVGKTQLAAAHARHAREQGAGVLVWASATSRLAIIDAYADAAVKLGLADREDPDRAAAEFLVWAETASTPWLVVLDDLHDPQALRQLWPPACPAGTTLVTTRRRDAALAGPRRQLIEVGLYTWEEARSYLHAKLGVLTGDAQSLDALIGDLDRLPLALAQAAAFMIDQHMDSSRYRKLLGGKLLAHAVPEPSGLPDEHQRIIAATWDLSIEQADRARPIGLARPLLQLTSVLDPSGIPAAVLTSGPTREYLASYLPDQPSHQEADPTLPAVTQVDADTVDAGVRVLHRFNLLDHDRQAVYRELRVHPLIQRATRERLIADPHHGADLYAALAQTAADALLAVWPATETDHLSQVLRANTTTLHVTTETALWHGKEGAHPILFKSANALGETGQVSAAVDAYLHLHVISNRLLGPDHPHTLTTRGNLVSWRGETGDAAGAAAAFEELLTDRLRILGTDHPDTLTTRSNLVSWRGKAGDAAGAARATEELLADLLRVLGPDHPHTLTTRGNLAYWWGEAGDAAGAARATEELLADLLRVLGPDHPDALSTRNNLAYWRGKAGDAAGAIAAFEQLLTDSERVLGTDHPHTLSTRNNLAIWRGEAGDAAGAARATEELLADLLRVLGPDHPHTLSTRNNLAYWRGEAGDAAGAAAALEELLADQERVLGPDHPHTLSTRSNLVSWRGEAGDAAGAARATEELLADQERVLGPDHPHTLTTRSNLATWRGAAGDAAGAAATLEKLLADSDRVLGTDHPDTLTTRNHLAYWRGKGDRG